MARISHSAMLSPTRTRRSLVRASHRVCSSRGRLNPRSLPSPLRTRASSKSSSDECASFRVAYVFLFSISPTQQPGYVLDLVHGSEKNGTKVSTSLLAHDSCMLNESDMYRSVSGRTTSRTTRSGILSARELVR